MDFGFQIGFLDFRVDFWISLDFWISDWISADSVRDFFRGGPLAPRIHHKRSQKVRNPIFSLGGGGGGGGGGEHAPTPP